MVLSQAADGLARSAAHWLVLDGGTVTASGPPRELIRSAELARTGTVIQRYPRPWPGSAPGRAAVRDAGPARSAAPVLELEASASSYAAGRRNRAAEPLLRDLDLTVRPGEIVAVTGRNGAGKSTLLRHFNGLLRPDSRGRAGRGNAASPASRRAGWPPRWGCSSSSPGTSCSNGRCCGKSASGCGGSLGKDAGARAYEALAAVGLPRMRRVHPAELPASKQRLLALATVLARQPAVLALDEPTVGLDRHGLEWLHRAIEHAGGAGRRRRAGHPRCRLRPGHGAPRPGARGGGLQEI